MAVTLLIMVTVAAAGTVYTQISSTQDEVEDNLEINLNADTLRVENCWNESGQNVSFMLRNTHQTDAINNSEITVLVSGKQMDPEFRPEGLVGPLESFQVRLENLGSAEKVVGNRTIFSMGESSITTRCYPG